MKWSGSVLSLTLSFFIYETPTQFCTPVPNKDFITSHFSEWFCQNFEEPVRLERDGNPRAVTSSSVQSWKILRAHQKVGCRNMILICLTLLKTGRKILPSYLWLKDADDAIFQGVTKKSCWKLYAFFSLVLEVYHACYICIKSLACRDFITQLRFLHHYLSIFLASLNMVLHYPKLFSEFLCWVVDTLFIFEF